MSTKLITAALVEPISIEDVEAQIQFDIPPDQVTLVEGFITAIRQRCENDLRRALVTSTFDLVLDAFPGATTRNLFASIEIPLPPLQSVVSIKYLSADGMLSTLAATEYFVDLDSTPGRVTPTYGKTWPATLDYPGSVRVQFVAGYGGPLAWDALQVFAVGERVLYTNGITYKKTAVSAAGVLPTDATKWAVDHPGFAVPMCIRQWMLLNVGALMENRESLIVGNGGAIDLSTLADSLLDPERWEVRV